MDRDEELLTARLSDAMEKCRRGSISVLPFLTPKEAKIAIRMANSQGMSDSMWFYGGYEGAERQCLYFLPEYLTACLSGTPMEAPTEEIFQLLDEELPAHVSALRVKGSGFCELTHRDYLGSVLGLGLKRDALGDIAVQNPHEAILFCSRKIADFLIGHLERVGNDKVRCRICVPDETFTDGRHYRPIADTVASARLDCIVAALTNLSRESAQNAIRTGLVEVDFECEERTDVIVEPPAILSVRGYGRYRLLSFDGETKKGRLRIKAQQYV